MNFKFQEKAQQHRKRCIKRVLRDLLGFET